MNVVEQQFGRHVECIPVRDHGFVLRSFFIPLLLVLLEHFRFRILNQRLGAHGLAVRCAETQNLSLD